MWPVLRFAGVVTQRGHRRSSAAAVLVIGLAAAAIVAAASVAGGTEAQLDRAFEQGRGAEFVVTTGRALADGVSAALHSDPAVAEVGPRRLGGDAQMVVDEVARLEHRLTVAPDGAVEAQELGAPVIREGRLPSAPDEIALDAALAIDREIAVGDSVSFDGVGDQDVEFRVTGTAYDFDDCFFPTCDPARSWVSADGLARLDGDTFAVLAVDLVDGADVAALEQRLTERFGTDAFGINSWQDTRADMLATTEFLAAFLTVFGVFVIVAVGLVLATSIVARALQSRRQIALMRAAGATPAQMTAALVAQQSILAAVGALVGWAAASLAIPRLSVGPMVVVGRSDRTSGLETLLLVCCTAVVVVALMTLVPAWRAARASLVDCLRDHPRQARHGARLGRLSRHAPPALDLGIRSWLARPFRSLNATGALTIAIVAGIVALSVIHSMDHVLAHAELIGAPGDVEAEPDGLDREAADRQLAAMPEVASWFSVVDRRYEVDGGPVHVRLVGGEPEVAGFAIGEGRGLQSAGEAIAGYTLFDANQWTIGERLTLDSGARASEVTLVGWYRETEDDGRVLTVSATPGTMPDAVTYVVTAAAGVTREQLAGAMSAHGWLAVVNEADAATARPFRLALQAMTFLLAAVAVAHIAATALATARLRAADLGVLRAIGGTPAQATITSAVGAVLSALLAAAVAIPVGAWLQARVGNTITSSIGVGPGASPPPPWLTLAALVSSLIILAVGADSLAHRWARRDAHTPS